jgi:hypothetical protein
MIQTIQTKTLLAEARITSVVVGMGVEPVRVADRHLLDRLGEQHVLRVDQVVARVLEISNSFPSVIASNGQASRSSRRRCNGSC